MYIHRLFSWSLLVGGVLGVQYDRLAQHSLRPQDLAQDTFDEPSEHLGLSSSIISLLESSKLCGNSSNVTLAVPGGGSLTFKNGYVYARPISVANPPIVWQIRRLATEPNFLIYHTDPFGRIFYLLDNSDHLRVTTYSGSAGRYAVRYASGTDSPSMVLSTSDKCISIDIPSDDKIYLRGDSPCTPLEFKKVESNAFGAGDDSLSTKAPVKWYDPARSDDDITCPSVLKRYVDKLQKGDLKSLVEMSRGGVEVASWPENFSNFVKALPLSIIAAPICGIVCAAGSVHCVPCQGQGGII